MPPVPSHRHFRDADSFRPERWLLGREEKIQFPLPQRSSVCGPVLLHEIVVVHWPKVRLGRTMTCDYKNDLELRSVASRKGQKYKVGESEDVCISRGVSRFEAKWRKTTRWRYSALDAGVSVSLREC